MFSFVFAYRNVYKHVKWNNVNLQIEYYMNRYILIYIYIVGIIMIEKKIGKILNWISLINVKNTVIQ